MGYFKIIVTSMFLFGIADVINAGSCVEIRNIHFTPTKYKKNEICIKGKVIEASPFSTYWRVQDKSGVIVVRMVDSHQDVSKSIGKEVVVWANVKIAQRGIPYLNMRRFVLVPRAKK